MNKSTWKRFERKVARYFGGERMPLSGMSNNLGKGDVIHPQLLIECKYKSKLNLLEFWRRHGDFRLKEELLVCSSRNFKTCEIPAKNTNIYRGWYNLFKQTEKLAEAEGKIPVVAVGQLGEKDFLIIVKQTDMALIREIINVEVKNSLSFESVTAPPEVEKYLQSLKEPKLLFFVAQAALRILEKTDFDDPVIDYILQHPQTAIDQLEELVLRGAVSVQAFRAVANVFQKRFKIKTTL